MINHGPVAWGRYRRVRDTMTNAQPAARLPKKPVQAASPLDTVLLGGVVILLGVFWHVSTMNTAASEFTSAQLGFVLRYVLAAMLALTALLVISGVILRRVAQPRVALWGLSLLAGAVLASAFMSLLLLHDSAFAPRPVAQKWLVWAAGVALSTLVAKALLESRWLQWAGLALGGVLAIFAVAGGGSADTASGTLADGQTLSPRGERVAGDRNIYLISFDSLVPPSLAQRFVGTEPGYADEMAAETELLQLSNGFTWTHPTKPSLNSILALDPDHFLTDKANRMSYFPGQAGTPLLDFLRGRGYRIQTVFGSPYMGPEQGPYVDHYGITKEADALCTHAASQLVFFGLCEPRIFAAVSKRFSDDTVGAEQAREIGWPDSFFSRIETTARDSDPWFTMTHLYWPGHTSANYNMNNPDDVAAYRAYYERQSAIAGDLMKRLFDHLRENDPNAVLMLYGDHGTYSMRGAGPSILEPPTDPADFDDWVVDHLGISLSIWPRSVCAPFVSDIQAQGWAVSNDVARRAVECATGEDPLDGKAVEWQMPIGRYYKILEFREYDDFVYE